MTVNNHKKRLKNTKYKALMGTANHVLLDKNTLDIEFYNQYVLPKFVSEVLAMIRAVNKTKKSNSGSFPGVDTIKCGN